MNMFYNEFVGYLNEENKEKALEYVIGLLESEEVDVVTLYEDILAPSLNNMVCNLKEKQICIWKEHIRSSIIRTIIECCYPYVLNEMKKKNIKVGKEVAVVVCPSEEYHELGARMVADFFTLCGLNTIFVGSNTPREEFISAIHMLKPRYVAISVTNYYNLVAAKRTIDKIREQTAEELKVLAGGFAFKQNKASIKIIGADVFIDSFRDIEKLVKEG